MRKYFGLELCGLLAYFVLGAIFYPIEEEWGVGDTIYFSFVVMTTVGYGDLLPSSNGSKIFTCFFVLFALAIASVSLASVLNAVVMKVLQEKNKTGIFDERGQQRKRRKRFLGAFLAFLIVLLIGTIVYAVGMDWEKHGFDGDKWVNGLYVTIMTVTTVGFGDLHPGTDDGYKFFTILLMVVGIPVFAFSLATFTEVIFGEVREKVELSVIEGGLCHLKFQGLEEFTREFAASGAGEKHDDSEISRFEFLSFILVQNGVVDIETIKEAMDNFTSLDRTKSNFLTKDDVNHWITQHSMKPDEKDSPPKIQVKPSAVCPE